MILNLMFLVLQGLIKYPGPISDKMSPEVTFTTPDGESFEINQWIRNPRVAMQPMQLVSLILMKVHSSSAEPHILKPNNFLD